MKSELFHPPRPFSGLNRWLALLLVVSFGMAAWKTFKACGLQSATQFVMAPRTAMPIPANASSISPSLSAPQPPPPADGFRFDAQFASTVAGRAVHAASLVELQNGDLRAVWFSGSREGAADVTIQTAVLDRSTSRWSAEATVFDRHQIERGLWRYVKKIGNPVIARSPDGSLMLWMVNVSLGGWAGSAITWARSWDDGTSWSVPQRLVTSPFLNISTLVKGAPVAYANGQIGLPVYHEFISKFAELLRLDAQGRVVDKVRIPASQASLQPVVLVTGPDKAQVYMRSGHATALMGSSTEDAGITWSGTHPTAWPNPDSALAGIVTHTGELWLALNPTTNNRETLALLATTKDANFEGMAGVAKWEVESSEPLKNPLSIADYEAAIGKELLESGAGDNEVKDYVASARRQLCGVQNCSREYSYPYLLQSRDGYVHLVYTWHRSRIKHIRFDPRQFSLAAKKATSHAAPAN